VVLEKDGDQITDRVRNEKVLRKVKEKRNILHAIIRRLAIRIGLILRRNCLLKHDIERKITEKAEVTRKRGRRRKQLLDYLQETRGFWELQEEATSFRWTVRFVGSYGPVLRRL
jgi:hypothetical protein